MIGKPVSGRECDGEGALSRPGQTRDDDAASDRQPGFAHTASVALRPGLGITNITIVQLCPPSQVRQ